MTTGLLKNLKPGDLVFYSSWRSPKTKIYSIVSVDSKNNGNFRAKVVYRLRSGKWTTVKTFKEKSMNEYSISPVTPETLTNILISLEEQAKFIKNLLNSL